MKSLLTTAAALFIGGSAAMAQAGKVTSAYNYLTSYQQYKDANDLREAVDYIEPATTNEKTMVSAKTFYYRGLIYHAIYQDSSAKAKTIVAEPLTLAADSYIKTLELDAKKEYAKDVIARLYVSANQFYNMGINEYNVKKNNLKAVEYFEKVLQINASPAMVAADKADMPYYGFLDTNATSLAAVAAFEMKDYDKAKKYFQVMIDKGFREGRPYTNLAQIHKAQGNNDAMMEVIKKGRAKFPEDAALIIEELNYYLSTGKDKEAEANLQLAISKDPNNHQLHFALGSIYDKLSSPDDVTKKPSKDEYQALRKKAETAYLKAIEISPEYFNAIYNLGALYFNEAGDILKTAGDIKDNKVYEQETKRAEDLLGKALPYLEKAHQLDAKDKNTLISLKELYFRNGNETKYAEIKALIGK
jgi:tetratricopeptide (TPR) repeat protein